LSQIIVIDVEGRWYQISNPSQRDSTVHRRT